VTINGQNIKIGDTIILINGDKVTLNLNGTITIIKANPLDLTITNLIIGYVINNNPVINITVPVPPSTNSTIIYNINTFNYYNNVVNPGTIVNLNIPNGAVIVTINGQSIKIGDTIILVNGDKVTLNLNGTITVIKANPLDTIVTNLIIGYVINNNPVVYITVPVPPASNSTIIYNNNTYNTTNNTYNTTNNNYNNPTNPTNPGTIVNINVPNGSVIVTINGQSIKLGDTIILVNGDKVTLNLNGTITIIKANPLDTTVTNLIIGYVINNNPVVYITVPVPPTSTSTIIYNSTIYNTTNNYNTNNNNQNNTIIVTPNLQPGSTITTINGQNITVNQTITLVTGDKVTLNVNGTLTVVRIDLTKDLIIGIGFVTQAGVNGSVIITILNNQSSYNQTNNYYSTVINVTGGNNTFNNNTNSANQVVINLAQVLPQGSNLITINGQTITIGQTITLMSGDKITYNNNGTITIINGNQTTNAPINITLGYTGVSGGGNITININNNQTNTCLVNGVNVCNNNNCTGNSCNITITLKPNTPPGSTITMIDNIVINAGQTITLINGDKITLNIDGTITVVRTNGSLVVGNYTLTVRTSDGKIITGNLTVNFVDPKSNPGLSSGNALGTVRSGANQNTYVLTFVAIIGFVYLALNKKYFNRQN
jgi:large repetitive protein